MADYFLMSEYFYSLNEILRRVFRWEPLTGLELSFSSVREAVANEENQ